MKPEKWIIFSLIIASAWITTKAQTKTKIETGLSGGTLFPGKFAVSMLDEDLKSKTAPIIKLYVDAYIIPQLAFGVYVSNINMQLKESHSEEFGFVDPGGIFTYWSSKYERLFTTDIIIWELGGSIKPCFYLNRLIIKPIISFSHRRFKANDVDFIDDSKALGINGGVDFQYKLSKNLNLNLESGFLTQPVGGNNEVDITTSGIFFVLIGISIHN